MAQLPPPMPQPPAGFGMPPMPPPPPGDPPPPLTPPGFSAPSPRTPRTPKMASPLQPGVNSPPPPHLAGMTAPLGMIPMTAGMTAQSTTAGFGTTGPAMAVGFGPSPQPSMLPYMAQPYMAQPQAMYAQHPAAMYAQHAAAMSAYPQQMLATGAFAQPGFAHPGAMVQPGYWGPQPLQQQQLQTMPVAGKPLSRKNLLQFSYLEDIAYANGRALSCCDSIFHERGRALKVCVPTAAFTVFFAVISVWMLASTLAGSSNTTLRQCKVLLTMNVKVLFGQASRYRPTLHVHFVSESRERIVTRFRDPGDYEVEFEEANRYLSRFGAGNTINCYEFDDGAVQIDDRDYISIWSYIIVAMLCSFSVLCYCVWMSSGFYACCSPNADTYQA